MSLSEITEAISVAEAKAGRVPGSVRLIAVSKVQPEDRVADVLRQGHRLFGENRVQEAAGRWPPFQAQYPDISLHLIGPLQTNKARQAVEMFDAIHTLDRPKLARRFADLAQERGASPELLIQVNTGEEPQKAGILPGETDAFVAEARALDLPVTGLMCIPPIEEEASLHFALLAKLAERNGLPELSMGMSADFEKAIAFGATYIRVGSAIFGERVAPQA
ncbi:YggS family pyridoxal phosphate-dependent enzyme [Fontisubflavum oceani]|uniref:YggS family pyridoxal phosphate-dependent enzyme n=1 Tax=Fontisubflavum oceani TaxID=2978973 RepID=UPI0025B31533|nr:YggS family pyridoxal phosphate-dependent enzyme [Fontisubflavum oceani]WJY22352.1 YggS family pyridoxal phosphate-dependent enzyme [Fontisubflavum oceani]